MKKLLNLGLALLCSTGLFAQTTNLGGPVSWNGKTDLGTTVPVEKMLGYDQAAIDAEDVINDAAKDAPWRFGYKYDTDINLENAGVWSDLPNGDRIWRVGINCKDAMTVNLIFENLFIPEGAFIYMYDINQTNRVGAYTHRNNRADGILGTELVHGDEIIVEYYEPADVNGQGSLTIANVIHGYRSLNHIQNELDKALNSSGDCNIDVNCPLGIGWEDQIRSVAMIVVSGNGICTGALINNTCDDGTPYFLTANHCLGGESSWAFRFNWESPPGDESCATTTPSVDPGAPYDQTANGATVLVSGTQADHALLQIDNMTVSDAQNWNCFYAGWDNSDDETVTQATGIHHPSGDVKKICREDNSPYHDNAGGPSAAVWMIDQWEEGVTEPGSSGSPLFDQNGRIIGQLYGGAAACSGTVNNGQLDYYGRLGVSWPLGIGTYLAPGGCGTSTTDDGWDPNTPTLPDDAAIQSITDPTGMICVDNFDPVVVLYNAGTNNLTSVTINYDIDAGTNNTFNWTGNLAPGGTEVVTLPNLTTTGGSHTFNCYTTLPNGNADSNPANDASASSYTATIGGQGITLEINTDCWGSEITWSIEDGGGSVMASGGPYTDITGGELITENYCLAVGCYDFIINDSYGDGMYGSQYGTCTVDGDYTITDDGSGAVLATIQAANSDFGNQEINNFCIAPPCSWTLSSSTVEETCFGDDDGSITVTVAGGTGPFTYDIGAGAQGSGTFTNQAQGSYNVVVDDGSCTTSISVSLGGPAAVTGTVTATDISCNGLTDGSVSVAGAGGDGSYTYDFGSGFGASNSATGLGAGAQSVTIMDGNGCTGSASGTVNEPGAISGTTSVTDEYLGSDGAIDLTVSGGTAPFTYAWTGPAGYTSTSEDITGLVGGDYSVTITDANGCTGSVSGVHVTSFVGLDENGQIQFSIYPNPANGLFNVILNAETEEEVTVSVIDVTGRVVYQSDETGNNTFQVDIQDKANGTYIIRVQIGEKQSQMRIVNNK